MTVQTPIPDHSAARQAMVDSQLRPQGVNDPAVIAAMASVPRERFVPEAVRELSYADCAVPLGAGRAMPTPAALGMLLTQLAPLPGEKALVVGAGTGYSAAVLAAMGVDAVALESSPELAAIARQNGLTVVEGPLEAGHRKGAPYDIILLDGAVELIPDAFVAQLKDGGRLGGALVEDGVTRLIVGRRAGGGFGHLSIADAGVPDLPGFKRPRAFTF